MPGKPTRIRLNAPRVAPNRLRSRLVRATVMATLTALLVTGCSHGSSDAPPKGGASSTDPNTSRPSSSGSGSPKSRPSIPAGGRSLETFGISNGPNDSVSLPADAVVTAESDQASLVEVAVSKPTPRQMDRYLKRTLPASGFTIEKHRRSANTPAISFTGRGWSGKFTGHGSRSGLTLRPAK